MKEEKKPNVVLFLVAHIIVFVTLAVASKWLHKITGLSSDWFFNSFLVTAIVVSIFYKK